MAQLRIYQTVRDFNDLEDYLSSRAWQQVEEFMTLDIDEEMFDYIYETNDGHVDVSDLNDQLSHEDWWAIIARRFDCTEDEIEALLDGELTIADIDQVRNKEFDDLDMDAKETAIDEVKESSEFKSHLEFLIDDNIGRVFRAMDAVEGMVKVCDINFQGDDDSVTIPLELHYNFDRIVDWMKARNLTHHFIEMFKQVMWCGYSADRIDHAVVPSVDYRIIEGLRDKFNTAPYSYSDFERWAWKLEDALYSDLNNSISEANAEVERMIEEYSDEDHIKDYCYDNDIKFDKEGFIVEE